MEQPQVSPLTGRGGHRGQEGACGFDVRAPPGPRHGWWGLGDGVMLGGPPLEGYGFKGLGVSSRVHTVCA